MLFKSVGPNILQPLSTSTKDFVDPIPFKKPPSLKPFSPKAILEHMEMRVGASYVWGG